MQGKLYKDDRQAQRVTAAAQKALARHIPAEVLAGTVSTWSMYNVMLHHRARALVEFPCREHGIDIQVLGEYPLFRGVKLVHGSQTDVVIVPADEDPLISTGKFPLPRQVAQRLRAIEQAGVPFDMLYTYIAHEVPRYSISEEGPIPLEVIMPPAPQQVTRLSRRLGVLAHAATSTLTGGMGQASSGLARGAGALTAGVTRAATLLLDPLIFGALADDRGMATWFVLAQWAW